MTPPHGPGRGGGFRVGTKLGPSLAHMCSVESRLFGIRMRAGLNRQKASSVRMPPRHTERRRKHDRVGRPMAHPTPGCGILVTSHRPEAAGGRVKRSRFRRYLSRTPARKPAQRLLGPLNPHVSNQLCPRSCVPGKLLPRGPIHDESSMRATVKNVVVPIDGSVRNHKDRPPATSTSIVHSRRAACPPWALDDSDSSAERSPHLQIRSAEARSKDASSPNQSKEQDRKETRYLERIAGRHHQHTFFPLHLQLPRPSSLNPQDNRIFLEENVQQSGAV